MIKNYGLNHEKFLDELDQELTIKIGRKHYKELINVSYEVDYLEHSTPDTSPDEKDDEVERSYLLDTLNKRLNVFEYDRNSRRLVYPNLYPNGLGKCISLVNAFIRNDAFHINIYIRSQNILKNFKYDCETMSILMKAGIDALHLKPGKITVFCTNLHLCIEDLEQIGESYE